MTSETRKLPLSPHPDHLRKEAKTLLAKMKTRDLNARLANAQAALARDYGFADWGAMMAEVAKRGEGPRSRAALFRRWRLRPVFAVDEEQEAHAAFFRVGAAAHVGFFLAAAAGLGMVLLSQVQANILQAAIRNLALLAHAIL